MKTLPIQFPEIYGRMYYSFPLTVISACGQYEDWFYSNFIQLQCSDRSTTSLNGYADFRFFNTSSPLCYEEVLDVEHCTRDAYTHENLAEFIVRNIDLGKYVYAYVDKFYVSDNPFTRQRHYLQETFVYGYDHSQSMFHIMGFNKDRIFSASKVPYSEITKGIREAETDYSQPLYFIQAKEGFPDQIDLHEICDLLKDYLDSRNTYERRPSAAQSDHLVFGISVYEMIELSLRMVMEDSSFIVSNIATMHILWEHKKMMVWRIEYLAKKQRIPSNTELIREYRALIRSVDFFRFKLMKYEVNRDRRLLEQIIDDMKVVKSKEEALLERSLKEWGMMIGKDQ